MMWMLSASRRWSWVSRVASTPPSAAVPLDLRPASGRGNRRRILRPPCPQGEERSVDHALSELLAVVEMGKRRVRHGQLQELAQGLPPVPHRPDQEAVGGNVRLDLLVE